MRRGQAWASTWSSSSHLKCPTGSAFLKTTGSRSVQAHKAPLALQVSPEFRQQTVNSCRLTQLHLFMRQAGLIAAICWRPGLAFLSCLSWAGFGAAILLWGSCQCVSARSSPAASWLHCCNL